MEQTINNEVNKWSRNIRKEIKKWQERKKEEKCKFKLYKTHYSVTVCIVLSATNLWLFMSICEKP